MAPTEANATERQWYGRQDALACAGPARQGEAVATKVLGQDVGDRRDARVLIRSVLGADEEMGAPHVAGYLEHQGYTGYGYGISTARSPMPFIVAVSDGELRSSPGVAVVTKEHCRFFWFFGYVTKLPWETQAPRRRRSLPVKREYDPSHMNPQQFHGGVI